MDINKLRITNPKRQNGKLGLYNYYAGYSLEFSRNILSSANLNGQSTILDPWNGSGTTTTACSVNGLRSLGIDINPVMVVVAKANLINPNDLNSLHPIAKNIFKRSRALSVDYEAGEPLEDWFSPLGAQNIKHIEKAIQSLLITTEEFGPLASNDRINSISALAAFYYVALFRTVREVLKPFVGTNPTWIKKPNSHYNKLRPSLQKLTEAFLNHTADMVNQLSASSDSNYSHERSKIKIGSSSKLDIQNSEIDFVLTSPPYCTRIDYAVATLPELSILGYKSENFDKLRRSMIGTTTVENAPVIVNSRWGKTCCGFLDQVLNHESKASSTYYYKNHVQYFHSVFKSVSEVGRVLKENGCAIFVVQNSFYKNLYNDLGQIYTEMAAANNLELVRNEKFKVQRAMAGLKYKSKYNIEENVLVFIK